MNIVILSVFQFANPQLYPIITGKAPFFTGQGDTWLKCGSCGLPLAKGIINGQIRGILMKCPECDCVGGQEVLPEFIGQVLPISPGKYNFSNPVRCRPDVALVNEKSIERN